MSIKAVSRSHVGLSLILARSLKVMDSSGDERLFEVRCSEIYMLECDLLRILKTLVSVILQFHFFKKTFLESCSRVNSAADDPLISFYFYLQRNEYFAG